MTFKYTARYKQKMAMRERLAALDTVGQKRFAVDCFEFIKGEATLKEQRQFDKEHEAFAYARKQLKAGLCVYYVDEALKRVIDRERQKET